MIKKDFVAALSEKGYYKSQVSEVINDIFCIIAEKLAQGEKVPIRGFGTFEVKTRKGCLVRDIHTKEQKRMEDYRVVTFRPSSNLKDAVRTKDPKKLLLLSAAEKI